MKTRRKIVKEAAGLGAIGFAIPNAWVKPIVDAVTLPAHAQTSTEECTTYFAENITTDFPDITLSVLLSVCESSISVRLAEIRSGRSLSFVGSGMVGDRSISMELENDPNPPGCAGTRGGITILSTSSTEVIFNYRNQGEIDAATRGARAPIGEGVVTYGTLNEPFCRVENDG